MPAIYAFLVVIWSLVGGHVTVHPLDGAVAITDLYGSPRQAVAASSCHHQQPEMWLSPDVDVETLVHEAAHAFDCLDDGVMNNSPSLRPAERPDWVSDYCWRSDAEWYACSVVYYRDVHPSRVAPWGPAALAAAGGVAPGTSKGAQQAGQ